MSKDDFFIGWAETPKVDRRFFFGAGLGLLAGTAATAGGVAALQNPVGKGTWNMGEIREWRGIATTEPYAMLRTLDLDGPPPHRTSRLPGQMRRQCKNWCAGGQTGCRERVTYPARHAQHDCRYRWIRLDP